MVDPIFFGERYVKPHDARWVKPTAQFQIDMVYHLLAGSRFDPELLKQVRRPEDAKELAETAFRTLWVPIEHAKTTWLSVVIPLWILVVDQETKGALIGNRQEDAMKPLAVIKWHIEHNQLLRADFPELREDRKAGWSEERIFVQRRDRTKDPSIQTAGITMTIQGARLDWVFGDDVQDRKRAISETMNHNDQENWQEINENRIVDGGIISSYGTLQTSRDLTATLSRRPGYRHLHLSAYDDQGRYGPVGEPIWMPRKRLEAALARQGTRRFARKYLNDAKDEGGKQLKAEWITIVRREEIPWKELTYYAGIDPATGEAETSEPDEYVICVVGRDRKHRAYVLGFYASYDWDIVQGTKELARLHRTKPFRRVAVESVAFSVAFKQHIWANTGIPAYKSPTTKDKATRFETMGAVFETQRAFLFEDAPGAFGRDTGEREDESFWDQWIDFPEGRHDDRLDACEKGLEAAFGGRRAVEPLDEETKDLLRSATLLG